MTSADGVILYKRWRLRSGATVSAVRRLVEHEIVPRYASLSPDVVLDLEADSDGLSVLAIQRWRSAEAHVRATTGAEYEEWWREYEPRLAEWDRLVDFVDEWTTVRVHLATTP
jgi:primosomal protein N''